ncbi:uncharacterized protein C594.04c [Malania oleifera]|uniref:uncharacterized protein C594.04c n=1 Tax=Malania oleifera TaxID=397392 RepID=UPI0025AE0CB4|nr:uncharacterized protein C594.04c [Malania oleifera]
MGGSGCRNLKNAVIALLVPLPSILFFISFLNQNQNPHYNPTTTDHTTPHFIWTWCLHHPLLLANALFFLNVNLLFWLIGLAQSSHWMIDLYWTVIPVLLVHFYANHPLAQFNIWRSRALILMTWVWSLRLTHNYLRREGWAWGAREDWRFADMRLQYGKNWWWISFFTVYVSQQVLLIGVCLPFYVVHSVVKPWSIWDFVAIAVCCCGITIAYHADTQLHYFVSRNKKLRELGKPRMLTLDEGLWRYSRHPNYFGEQLWWWGLAIFGWNLGQGWTFIGALVNTMCLAHVTKLVEDRIMKEEYRAEAYRLYQQTTSVWVPWFKSSSVGGKDKSA